MTAENDPIIPGSPVPPGASSAGGALPPPTPPPHRRKRRLILKILGVLVVLLVLLILLAPTLIGSGPVVSIILGQVNKQLNGRVTVDSLSLSWLGGVDLKGVHVFDVGNAQIAGLDHVVVPLALWKVVTGNYALGNVVIDGITFDARIDAQGHSNFEKLVKSNPAPTSTPAPTPTSTEPHTTSAEPKPSKLPNISGDIKLTNCTGKVSQEGKPIVYLNKLEGEVKIPDINQPITDTLAAVIKVGEQPEGQINVAGTAAVIKSNQVAVDTADVHQTLDVQNLSLAAAKPFMPADKFDTLEGVLGAHVAIDLTAGQTAVMDVSINGKQKIAIGGKSLKGDTFTTTIFTAAVPKLTANFPEGLGKWQTGRIRAGDILLQIDQGQLTLAMDAEPSALLNVIANVKPGSAGNLALADHLDLAALAGQLPHLLNFSEGVAVTNGLLAQNVKADWTTDKSTLSATTDVTDVRGQRTTAGVVKPINLSPIHLAIEAGDSGGGSALAGLQDMKLTLQSKFAAADFQGPTLAALSGKLHADLKILESEVGQIVDLSSQDLNGTLDADLSESGQLTAAPYQSKLTMNLQGNGLKVGKRVNLPVLQVALTADLHGSEKETLNSVQNLQMSVKTGDGTSAPADVMLVSANANFSLSAKSMTDYVSTAHARIDVPSVKQAMMLVDTLSPPVVAKPAATDAKATTTPMKPLEWDGGSLSTVIDLSRDPNGLKSLVNLTARDLAFHHGDIPYHFKPIAIKLAAILGATTTQVTDLAGDLGIATLSMPTPVTVTKVGSNRQANGGVKLVGSLAELTQLMSAYQGKKPDAYPYRGDYTLTENIGSKDTTTGLKGGIDVGKFQVYNGSTVTFSEDLLSIANDLSYTTAGDDADVNISSLTVSMKSSGAANVSLTNASVQKLNTDRILQLQPKLDYDLVKLWPIIQPVMGDKYKTLKITGHYQKQFNVTGSYPANQASTVAIKTVKADGDLAVGTFDYNGLNIKNLIVPVTLEDGKLMTVYAGRPAGQNTAAPAIANEGTLDVGNLTFDLTQSPPRLMTPANKVVISKLTINPIFANTYLTTIFNNPIFSSTQDATGLLDLTITDCEDLPLGSLVIQQVAENTGKIDLMFSLTKLNIGLQGVSGLSKALKQDSFTGNVNNATVSIAKGLSTQKIDFNSGKFSLDFEGTVRLADENMIPLNLSMGPIPAIANRFGIHDDNTIKHLPDRVIIPFHGPINHPNVDFGPLSQAVAKALAGGGADALINKAFGGGKNSDNSDPLGGLFNKLNKKRKDSPNNSPLPQ